MTWGKDTSEEEAGQQLTAFVDAGGTLVDTADIYTGGQGERILGRLLRSELQRQGRGRQHGAQHEGPHGFTAVCGW